MSGGWYSLLAIKQEWQQIALEAEQERSHPVACPHDGEPLEAGPHGELHCPWGDFTLA